MKRRRGLGGGRKEEGGWNKRVAHAKRRIGRDERERGKGRKKTAERQGEQTGQMKRKTKGRGDPL